jgi:periplasmic protein TonB
MTTNVKVLEMPPKSTYGAVEIKEFIRKYTWQSFLYTMAILILLFLLSFIYNVVTSKKDTLKIAPPLSKITMTAPPATADESQQDVAPPPSQANMDVATITKAGTPVPVPDAEITSELKEFASMDELDKSLSKETGTVVNLSDMPQMEFGDKQPEKKIDIKEAAPDMNEFVAVEKEAQVDLGELQKKIEYPEVARRAGIEGKVIVRVLVDPNGRVKKAVIQQSDSQMLNTAALDAVKKSVFTPAIQNGKPILCWVSIPIQFRLK